MRRVYTHSIKRCKMAKIKRILTIAAILSCIVGYFSCGEDSSPVTPSPPEYGVPTFGTRIDYQFGGDIYDIVAEDLDGDGDCDLALPVFFDNRMTVMLNNGDGTFQPVIGNGAGLFTYSASTIVGADLDGDGDCDIITGSYRSVTVLRNLGDATFSGSVPFSLDSDPKDMCLSDVDGDGDLDLAAIVLGELHLLLNDGNASFEHVSQHPLGEEPVSVCTSDLDGDGDMDFAVSNEYSFDIAILMNNGDGTFQDAVIQSLVIWGILGDAPIKIISSDLDGDGDKDLAVAGRIYCTYVLFNSGDGIFTGEFQSIKIDARSSSLVSVDLDGDGDIDLATANRYGDCISVLLNGGDGAFTFVADYYTDNYPHAIESSDFDGDGDADLAVVVELRPSSVSVFLNGINE
jgi:hypothetical protein